MRPSAAPESDHGDGAPARDRGAARPSGALTQVPSTAPKPQIPPRAPRYARAPLTLRPTPAAALVQPGRACAEPADRPVLARAGGFAGVQLTQKPLDGLFVRNRLRHGLSDTHISRSGRPPLKQRPARCWQEGAPARVGAPAAGYHFTKKKVFAPRADQIC